jgi:hypothetical protein
MADAAPEDLAPDAAPDREEGTTAWEWLKESEPELNSYLNDIIYPQALYLQEIGIIAPDDYLTILSNSVHDYWMGNHQPLIDFVNFVRNRNAPSAPEPYAPPAGFGAGKGRMMGKGRNGYGRFTPYQNMRGSY